MSSADLIDHLKRNSLRNDLQVTLRSGATSSWYLDGKQTTFDGEGAWLVGQAVLEILAPEVEAVGGMTLGADPVALATAMVAVQRGRPLRAFSVRKAAKDHGVPGRLAGPVRPGDVVAVVEDTTTTGGALAEAVEVVIAEGLQVVQVISVVDRSGGTVREMFAGSGIEFVGIVGTDDLEV